MVRDLSDLQTAPPLPRDGSSGSRFAALELYQEQRVEKQEYECFYSDIFPAVTYLFNLVSHIFMPDFLR